MGTVHSTIMTCCNSVLLCLLLTTLTPPLCTAATLSTDRQGQGSQTRWGSSGWGSGLTGGFVGVFPFSRNCFNTCFATTSTTTTQCTCFGFATNCGALGPLIG